jgi:hypothetical protein
MGGPLLNDELERTVKRVAVSQHLPEAPEENRFSVRILEPGTSLFDRDVYWFLVNYGMQQA